MNYFEDDDDYPEEFDGEDISIDNDAFIIKPEPQPTSSGTFIQRCRDKIIDFFSKHPLFIGQVQSVVSAIVEFNTPDITGRKEPLKIFNGALSFIDSLKSASFSSAWNFLSAKNGFESLFYGKINVAFLFKDILTNFPCRTIKFLDNHSVQIYALPVGEVYYFKYSTTDSYLYFNRIKTNSKALLDFLVAEKLKSMNSNFMIYYREELSNGMTTYSLKPFIPTIKTSGRSKNMIAYVKKFIDAGLNRSIMFYGAPGTGKSLLSQSIMNALNYKTLIFSASYDINKMTTLDNIVELFGIEALIIDDFDQLNSTNSLLDMLEMLNRKLKLVIGIANSLEPFHPAILRPGRFDEVELVDELDEEYISEVLGKLSKTYLPLVKHWPIAYINELIKRSKFDKGAKLKKHYEELNERVLDQLAALSG